MHHPCPAALHLQCTLSRNRRHKSALRREYILTVPKRCQSPNAIHRHRAIIIVIALELKNKMTYTLPAELQDSYRTSSDYPENLIPSGIATYRTRLSSYKKRLDDAERDLCLVPSEDDVGEIFEIPVIDLATGHGEGRTAFTVLGQVITLLARVKKRLHSPDKLTEWLGVTAAQVTSSSSARQLMARKRDPKCRFM